MGKMPKAGFFLLLLLLLPTSALAQVKVEILNNLEGSNNSVKVNSGSVNNQTDIRINNNGEVKEYHGEGGNIELKSSDGKSSVSVNTTGAANNSQKSTSNVTSKTNITVNSNTSDASASSTPEATVAGIFNDNSENQNEKSGLLEYIKKQFQELLNLFS